MKNSIKFKLLSIALTCCSFNVSAFEFSPYSCTYERMLPYGWFGPIMGYMGYVTKLGWNQVSAMDTFIISDVERNTKLGVCSYFSSTIPEYTTMNIKFITGKNLDLPTDNDCSFSGEVSFELTTKEITQNEDYHYARKFYEVSDAKFEILEIVGMQTNADVPPTELCIKAFNEATKNDPPYMASIPQSPNKMKIKFKDMKGLRRIK